MNKIILFAIILASAFGLIVSAMGHPQRASKHSDKYYYKCKYQPFAVNTTAGNTTDVGTATELEKLQDLMLTLWEIILKRLVNLQG